jgi:pimeloyl-ACP methyl ester carboxylesterase
MRGSGGLCIGGILVTIMPERATIAGLTALVTKPTTEVGPPLLFVHGYFGLAVAFERMMECLTNAGHRCVAINLRGHADSAPVAKLGKVSIRDYADDVERVARELGNPIIVGHSMGGLLAQLAAVRGAAKGIVLLSPAPPRGIPVLSVKLAIHQAKYMPAIMTSRIVVPGRSDLRALVLNRMPEAEREMVLDMLVPDSGRAARDMSVFGVPVDRAQVRVPVLVVAGDEDFFIPLSRAKRVALRYGAPLIEAPGRGHMLIIEPGYEEICGWIAEWVRANFSGERRGAA